MDIIEINVGEAKTAKPPTRLRTNALGSCIACVLYDKVNQIGGIAHIMLPSTDNYLYGSEPLKYADEAIPYLIKEMEKISNCKFQIANLENNLKSAICNLQLTARLVGGAMVVEDTINIGAQVTKSVEEVLGKYGIEIIVRKVGGHESRSVTLDTATGTLWYTENSGVEKAL